MAKARIYMKVNNPNEDYVPGVPLRDIEMSEWSEYPEYLKKSVDASKFYRKPAKKKAVQAEAEAGEVQVETEQVQDNSSTPDADPDPELEGEDQAEDDEEKEEEEESEEEAK